MENGSLEILIIFGFVTLIVCTRIICNTIIESKKCKHEFENSEPLIVEDSSIFNGGIKEKHFRIIQTCKKCGHIKTVHVSKWADKND